jgi:FtsP/CotA-like multicopper oxidase with cupredoxin domain
MRLFELSVQTGQVAFDPGRSASTLGINGPYLGPTLRASIGDTVAFNIGNTLSEATALHRHGMHLPATMDGNPHQQIAPGGLWQPAWTIRQEAATLWYHAHTMGQTRAQVSRGLAGMFIIDDDSPGHAAPSTYGVNDLALILQDYFFGGAQILVNGGLTPRFVSTQPRLRLRLLNATNQQILRLGFAGDPPFHQVASDGGLLNAPVQLTRVTLGPAERVEISVDLSDTLLVLQHFPANTTVTRCCIFSLRLERAAPIWPSCRAS